MEPIMTLRTPQEILNQLSADRQEIVKNTIEVISKELEKQFSGSPVRISLPAGRYDSGIFAAIKKILLEKSWCLESIKEVSAGYNEYENIAVVSPLLHGWSEDIKEAYFSNDR
jgi:hypothetical protein